MKFRYSIPTVLMALPLVFTAFQASAAEAVASADGAYAAFDAMLKEQPREDAPVGEGMAWYVQNEKICRVAESFIRQYPQDPRRWAVLNVLTTYALRQETQVDARADRVRKLTAEALTATDIGADDWGQAKSMQIEQLLTAASRAGADADLAPIGTALDEMRHRVPDFNLPRSSALEFAYVERLNRKDPALARARLEKVAADTAAPDLARRAGGKLYVKGLREHPVELKFVALDGRKVDLKKLRGKVVLVDFWATWCGPCVAELPNLKAVYDKYHEQGFEVVGISVDKKDDRKKLEDFLKDRRIPWPQFLDEKNERNEVSESFGITAVPAPLLFNRKGLLINDRARGEKLDEMVKGLLESQGALPHR